MVSSELFVAITFLVPFLFFLPSVLYFPLFEFPLYYFFYQAPQLWRAGGMRVYM